MDINWIYEAIKNMVKDAGLPESEARIIADNSVDLYKKGLLKRGSDILVWAEKEARIKIKLLGKKK